MHYIGEISAICAALAWSMCAVIFTVASRRIGAFSMNHYKTTFAVAIIAIMQLVTKGALLPYHISSINWILLALSGIIGFVLADSSLYQSYMDIGTRKGILIFNFYPLVSTVLAWFFLGEALSIYALVGIAVTTSGIVWVVSEKIGNKEKTDGKHFTRGVLFAVAAGLFQAIGFTLVKPIMTGTNPVDPLTTTLLRGLFGCATYWLVTIFRGRLSIVLKKTSDKKSMKFILLGSLIGSSFGVLLAMIAVKMAPVGVASTLMALMPVMILPMVVVVHKEQLSMRAIIGTIIACAGVGILFNV